jgi:hypothetical protein
MGNFLQATEHYVQMYAKFGDFNFYVFFVNKYSKIWVIGIFYEAIKHEMEFGQAYCQDLLKGIPRNFTLYFFWVLSYFLWFFWILKEFLKIKLENGFGKWLNNE